MRKLALLMLCSSAAGCVSDTAANVAEIGWSFDYTDHKDSTRPTDVRGCDNQPATVSGPAYDAIAAVHITLADPKGQVPCLDKDYD